MDLMGKREPMKIVPFRLPAALVTRLDRHAARLRKAHPGIEVTRADALRQLLIGALEREEVRNAEEKA